MHDLEYLHESIKKSQDAIDDRLTSWAEGNETDREICKHQFELDRLWIQLLRKGVQFENGELPEIKYLIYTIMYFIESDIPLCALLEIYEAQKRLEGYESDPERKAWVDDQVNTLNRLIVYGIGKRDQLMALLDDKSKEMKEAELHHE